MGATAFSIGVRARGAEDDASVVLPARIHDLFLQQVCDALERTAGAFVAKCIGRLNVNDRQFLIEVGGPFPGRVSFWFDESVGWARSFAEHCVRLAVASRRLVLEAELARAGFVLDEATVPNAIDVRRGAAALFFTTEDGRVGVASSENVEWQAPYVERSQGFDELSKTTQSVVLAVLERGECACPMCADAYTPSPAAASFRAFVLGEQSGYARLLADRTGHPLAVIESTTPRDLRSVFSCATRPWCTATGTEIEDAVSRPGLPESNVRALAAKSGTPTRFAEHRPSGRENDLYCSADAERPFHRLATFKHAIADAAADPRVPARVFVVSKEGELFRSTNGGESFDEVALPLGARALMTLPADVVCVFGARKGRLAIARSVDGGATFSTRFDIADMGEGWDLDAVIEPCVDAGGNLLVRYGMSKGGVLLSRDAGQTFQPFAYGRQVRSLLPHPTRAETAWVWVAESLFLVEPESSAAPPAGFPMLPLGSELPLHVLPRIHELLRRGMLEEALSLQDVALGVSSSRQRWATRAALAIALQDHGQHERAARAWEPLLAEEEDPFDRYAHLLRMAESLAAVRRYDDAERAIGEALSIARRSGQPGCNYMLQDVEAFVARVKLLVRMGRRDDALALAMERVPLSDRTKVHWSGMYGGKGVEDEVHKTERRAAKPERDLLVVALDALRALGRYDELVALARKALTISGWHYPSLMLGHGLFALGAYADALAAFESAAKVGDARWIQNFRADALLALGRKQAAKNAYRKVLDACPLEAAEGLARWHRLYASLALQDVQSAEAVIAASPQTSALLRGRLALLKGEREAALTALREAAQGDPAEPNAAFHFARALAQTGDVEGPLALLPVIRKNPHLLAFARKDPLLSKGLGLDDA